MVGVVWLVSWLVAGIVWLTWQHRAHRQLRQLGTQGLQFTPGWGVGWWFVPVANLWKPYQAIKELWVASDPEKGASDSRGGRAWTVLPWVVGRVADLRLPRLGFPRDGSGDRRRVHLPRLRVDR